MGSSGDRADVVASLERDWRREIAGASVAWHFQRWREREPVLRRFGDPRALVRFLRASAAGERQDELLLALLRCARDDPLAARLLLVRLLPGVKHRIAHRVRDPAEREELWSLLLTRLWQRIRSYPTERLSRHVAANLILTAVRETVEARRAERKHAAGMVGEPSLDLPAVESEQEDSARGLGVDALLKAAVDAEAITVDEQQLIAATRLDGQPLDAAAAERGVSRHGLVMRRLRAEQRLLGHMGIEGVTHRGENRLTQVLANPRQGSLAMNAYDSKPATPRESSRRPTRRATPTRTQATSPPKLT